MEIEKDELASSDGIDLLAQQLQELAKKILRALDVPVPLDVKIDPGRFATASESFRTAIWLCSIGASTLLCRCWC